MSKKMRKHNKIKTAVPVRAHERELPVFVYGTLLPGFGNYQWNLAGNTLMEEKATMPGKMYDYMGSYPVVDINEPGTVKGAIIHIKPAVFQEVLANLDSLEGYVPGQKDNMYERVVVNATAVGGSVVECYTYTMGEMFRYDNRPMPIIENGDWAEFISKWTPRVTINKSIAKFDAVDALITAGANELLNEKQIADLLTRHYSGDWGECDEEDAEINNDAVASGDDSLMSVFTVDGNVIWVYTEWDRSKTTILLPCEW